VAFANAVNRDDLTTLGRKVRARALWRRLRPASARVQATWAAFESQEHVPPYDLPLFKARQRAKLGCEGDESFEAVVARRFLAGDGLVGVSIGCGAGWKEQRWAWTGRFAHLDAFDLTADLIARAREQAREAGVDDVVSFSVANAHRFEPRPGGYDVVIADSSLHHLTGVEDFVAGLRSWLRPGGRVVVREYVGPARFQWRDDQVAAAQELLAAIPSPLRTLRDGRRKDRVRRPGRLLMRFVDPSEAVQADRILPALERCFAPVWQVDQGGSVVNLVFDGIAHHFMDTDDDAAQAHVRRAIEREDDLVASGALPSDNVAAVYALRSG
jgi:SAM-dependent methyltransferase